MLLLLLLPPPLKVNKTSSPSSLLLLLVWRLAVCQGHVCQLLQQRELVEAGQVAEDCQPLACSSSADAGSQAAPTGGAVAAQPAGRDLQQRTTQQRQSDVAQQELWLH
jgi:hypothetical protein